MEPQADSPQVAEPDERAPRRALETEEPPEEPMELEEMQAVAARVVEVSTERKAERKQKASPWSDATLEIVGALARFVPPDQMAKPKAVFKMAKVSAPKRARGEF